MYKSFRFKKGMIFLTALVFVLGLFTLFPTTADAAKKVVKVRKVAITDAKGKKMSKLTLNKGKTYNLKKRVKVTPKNASNKKVTYKSSNKKIVSISNKGRIKAVKKGTATITVTAKSKKKAKIKVTVKEPEVKVTSVAVNPAVVKLEPRKTVSLTAVVSPTNANKKTVVWKSSNSGIATVSASGLVTGISAGTAEIRAEAQDGSGKFGICKVTVESGQKKITSIILSGSGLTEDAGTYALSVFYQTPLSAVLERLAGLEVKGIVEGTGETVVLQKPKEEAWAFETTYRPNTIGTYQATAKLVAPAGTYFAAEALSQVKVDVNVSAIQITKVTLSGTGLTVGTDDAYSISIPYGTSEANAKSALAALTRTVAVGEGASPPTSNVSAAWNIADYNASQEGTYQATATFGTPTGYIYAQGANTANVSVIVEAPTAITGINLSSSTLTKDAMTIEADIRAALAAINISAVVASGEPPALTKPGADAWTFTPAYTGAAGTYTATATIETAPAGFRFNTGVNDLSVSITITAKDVEITALDISGTGYVPNESGNNVLTVDYDTSEADALAALADLTIQGIVASDKISPEITVSDWSFANGVTYNSQAIGQMFEATATISAPTNYKLVNTLSPTLKTYIRVSTPKGVAIEQVDAGYGTFGALDFETADIDDLINAPVWDPLREYYPVNEYSEGGVPKAGAIFKVFADENYLYTMATVYKQDPLSVGSGNTHEQDSFEVFLNEGERDKTSYDEIPDDKAVQYRVNYENLQTADHGPLERLSSKAKIIDGGYIVLTRVAFVEEWNKTEERTLGFELQVNLARGSSRTGTITLFNAHNTAFENPSEMGKIVLAP